MPIVNYKNVAKVAREHLFNLTTISQTNKDYLRKFFDSYDVSPARISLFCKHIRFLLEATDDIKRDMNNKDLVNKIFKDLRETVKPGYYETIKAVSLRLVKWLNDGTKPAGFKDIMNSKKGQKRDLKPGDMITWEEGLTLGNKLKSVQMKAIITTQLDGGFRPSEFIDLNYGDIVKEDRFLIAHISKGKTGRRDVILFRCVPYLNRWLESHPTKNPNDPLWIIEEPNQSRASQTNLRYKYPAIIKKIRNAGQALKLNKPLDFYNLRHSACTIAKLDNINTEEAAKKFGHSVKYYTETYGRLSTKDSINRFKKAYGEAEEKTEDDKPIKCTICNAINEPKTLICEKCSNPLSIQAAISMKQENQVLKTEVSELKEQLKLQEKRIEVIFDKFISKTR